MRRLFTDLPNSGDLEIPHRRGIGDITLNGWFVLICAVGAPIFLIFGLISGGTSVLFPAPGPQQVRVVSFAAQPIWFAIAMFINLIVAVYCWAVIINSFRRRRP